MYRSVLCRAHQWRQWKARLVLDPKSTAILALAGLYLREKYSGKPYTGRLCRFFNLGQDRNKPHAGSGSYFRALWVEVNGGQPVGPLDMDISTNISTELRLSLLRKTGTALIDQANWYSIVREIHCVK